MSIRQTESRFARGLENLAHLSYAGWVENVNETTCTRPHHKGTQKLNVLICLDQ